MTDFSAPTIKAEESGKVVEAAMTDIESQQQAAQKTPDHLRDQVDLPQDTYTLLFLSDDLLVTTGAIYVFFFKITLYALLLAEDLHRDTNDYHEGLVTAAQALLLPVAVAMQQDLTSSFGLAANVKYCSDITADLPGATYPSYIISLCLRFVDGFFSLTVNAVVLFHATSVFSMFLNFAALHFLQSIDDIVHELCSKGFFGDRIQKTAKLSQDFQLPARRDDHWMRCTDTVGLLTVFLALVALWVWFLVDPPAVVPK